MCDVSSPHIIDRLVSLTSFSFRLVPILFSCGKHSGTLTQQMVTATFSQLINCIGTETDASFLASLFKCFLDTTLVIGGPSALSAELHSGLVEATKRQLQSLADKRKARAARPAQELRDDKEDLALLEEMEDFALEDLGRLLRTIEPGHALLIAVASVRELGLHLAGWESGDEEGVGS